MQKRHFGLALLLIWLLGTGTPGFGQLPVWTQLQKGINSAPNTAAHVTDTAGNNYILTAFTGQLVLGNDTLASPGIRDNNLVLTKYTSSGQKVWHCQIYERGALQLGAASRSCFLKLDAQQRPILLISRCDTIQLGSTRVPGNGPLLVKFSQTGSVVWMNTIRVRQYLARRPYSFFIASGLALDAADNIYFAGGGGLEIRQFDNIRLDSTHGSTAAVLAKYDANGQFQWVLPSASLRGNVTAGIARLAVSPNGNGIIYAPLRDSIRLGEVSGPHTIIRAPAGQGAGYIARFGPTGTIQGFELTANCIIQSIISDRNGNYYVSGGGTARNWQLGNQTRPNRGLFVGKLLPSGTAAWITQPTQPVDTLWQAYNPGSTVSVDNAGHTLLSYFQFYTTTFGEYVLRSGGNQNLRAYLVQFDPQGAVEWAINQRPIDYNWDLSIGTSITHDNAGHAYWVGVQGSRTLGTAPNDYNGLFLQKINLHSNRLTGRVYVDRDGNGVRTAGEGAFPQLLSITNLGGPFAAVAELPSGRFHLFADTGRYDLQLPTVPRYHRLTQGLGGYQGNFAAYNLADSARHFGIAPIPDQQDVRVTLTPYTPARRGIPTRYRARIENLGTTTVPSGQLTVQLDPAITIIGTVPTATLSQPQVRGWSFSALPPLAARDFDISLNLPLNISVGTLLVSSAAVSLASGDLNLADNADTLRQTVVGSYDPNDITVNYSTLTAAQIAAGVPLDYTVRFQNMGTDTAFAITIQDTLPATLLQLSTIELISQSHSVQWSLNSPGVIEMRFPGTRLPHQAIDAVGSQGFVRFRIVPRPTLAGGTLIPNRAHILFDFNPPVTTNDVTTLVQSPTGLPHEPGATALSLYPNPATEHTRLTATLSTAGTVHILLLDALGRTVRSTRVTAQAGEWQHRLGTSGLVPGVYVVRLALPDGATVSRRLVVR